MTKIQLKRSSALLSGSARVPASNQLDYGELAINYSSTDPQLFYKDSGGNVVSFFEPYAPLSGATFTGDCTFNTDVDFDGAVTIQGDSTNGSGKLTLTCEQNTHSVNIKAPAHSASANYTLTLPSSAGSSGEVLSTDGSGGLSWAYAAMSTADKSKLDGIETSATADQTGAEIKALYEVETNAFTDALFTKLSGIETNATADQTGAEMLAALLTVDGSGSGLDADLLDGLQPNTAYSTSTIVQRDGSGDIRGRYLIAGTSDGVGGWLRSRTGADANQTPTSYVVESNGWYYQLSKSDFQSHIAAGLTSDKANLLASRGSYHTSASTTPASWDHGQRVDFVSSSQGWFDYGTVITTRSYSGGGGTLQMYVPYGSSYGGVSLKYRMGDYSGGANGNSWTSWRTIWDSNNDGAGSGLDADNLDGYTWGSSGKDVRASEFYADNWFRNYNAGEGLYNQATAQHFYSASSTYWHINSSNGLVCYTAYNGSSGHASNRKGYLYWSNDGFGLLSSAGTWCVNIPPSGSSSNALIVGGHASNNQYNSVSSSRMSFGGGTDFANYHLGTNTENYGGSYTKLDLRWHTGIRMGAQSQYGGIRFYDSEDLGSLQWHFNGSSGYTYKYNWLNTTTAGFFSSTNSWHIEPNTLTSYGSMNVRGNRGGWYGISFHEATNDPHLMFDNSGTGRGGFYWQGSGRWALFYDNSNNSLGICSSTTSSSYQLYVTGAIYATGNITAYSDARMKTNVSTIESALNKVLNLRGVTYNKINVDKTVSEKDEMGVIAQEVEKIVPEVVTYAEDVDEYGVSYGNLTALLIEAIKELKIELTELKESLT